MNVLWRNGKSGKYFFFMLTISLLMIGLSLPAMSQAQAQGETTSPPTDSPAVESTPSADRSQPSVTIAGCASFTLGSTQSGTIPTPGGTVCYTFEGAAGDWVYIRMLDTGGTAFYPKFQLYNPNNDLVCFRAADPLSAWECQLNQTGTYTIVVGDNSGSQTGNYNLFIQNTKTPNNPTPFTLGQVASGNIAAKAGMNTYTFEAAADDWVYLRMLDTGGTGFYPEFRLYRPDGTLLCFRAADPLSAWECQLNQTGTYTLLAGDNNSQTGSYNLFIQNTKTSNNPTPFTLGNVVSGNIPAKAGMNTYTFEGAAYDWVYMRMLDTGGTGFYPEFRLYRPDGTLLCFRAADPLSAWECQLNQTGTYTLLVGDNNSQTGSYNLFIQNTKTSNNPTPFTLGNVASGNIPAKAGMNTYTFEGAADDWVYMRMLDTGGTGFYPEFRLYRPDGTLLCFRAADPLSEWECQLNQTGTYTLLVGDNDGSQIGNYNLFIQNTKTPNNPTPFIMGQVASGNIPAKVGMNTYTFEGAADDWVYMRMLDTAGTGFYPEFRLYRPDGSLLCFRAADPLAEWECQLNQTGIYTLVAGDNNSQTGGYNLFVQRTKNPNAPTAFTLGQAVSGNVPTKVGMSTYTFEATADDWAYIRALDVNGTAFYPEIRLYRPDGTLLCYRATDPLAEWECELNQTGTYTLLVGDNNSQTGSYNLFVQRTKNPNAPTAFNLGQVASGNIPAKAGMNTYTFEGSADDWVYMRMLDTGGTGFYPEFRLYGPDGTLLCFRAADPLSEWECQLNQTGTYTLLAGDNNSQTGSYNLFVQNTRNPNNSTVLILNTGTPGNIAAKAGMNTYTFGGTADDLADIRMLDTGGTGFYPEFRLYRPDGTLLCFRAADPVAKWECELNQTGTYTLLAGDNDGSHTGNYTITVGKIVPPAPGVPVLLSPANNALTKDLTPRMNWQDSTIPPGVVFDHYQIQVATDSAFTSIVIDEVVLGIGNSEFTPPADLASNTKFFWHVRGCSTTGQCSNWSARYSYRTIVDPPTLLLPGPGSDSLTLRPLFDWDPPSGPGSITGYTIQISKNQTFTQIMHTASIAAPKSEYTPTVDMPKNQVLHWRMQTKGANGPSAWSETRFFNSANSPSKPVLLAPVSGVLLTDDTPLLKWKPVTLPTGTTFKHYQVQVDDDSDFSSPLINDTSIVDRMSTEFQIATPLVHNTKYYWRVRAVNTDDELSNWSARWNFRIRMDAPILLTPTDDSTVDTLQPGFEWEDVTGAGSVTNYTIQISASPTFSSRLVNASTVSSSYKPGINLPAHKTLYWRVRVNGANGPSAWSPVFSFVTP